MKKYAHLAVIMALVVVISLVTVATSDGSAVAKSTNPGYEVRASNARLNRLVTGDVTAFVDGVPAEPVHSFVWDGYGSVGIVGEARVEIDPVANTGEIRAEWHDENGDWEFTQTVFAPPPHATGLRVGPDASTTVLVTGDPVTTNVYLHGNTTAGGPVLPTLFNLLATWGPAEVRLNGEAFDNPFDGPTPLWVAHTMTTVGARAADGTVRTVAGEIFNPLVNPANGAVDNDDLEFHIVFHDAPGPAMTNNFPPPHAFFYHLMFEDVSVEVSQAD